MDCEGPCEREWKELSCGDAALDCVAVVRLVSPGLSSSTRRRCAAARGGRAGRTNDHHVQLDARSLRAGRYAGFSGTGISRRQRCHASLLRKRSCFCFRRSGPRPPPARLPSGFPQHAKQGPFTTFELFLACQLLHQRWTNHPSTGPQRISWLGTAGTSPRHPDTLK
jgi:hypothetical protein